MAAMGELNQLKALYMLQQDFYIFILFIYFNMGTLLLKVIYLF